MFGSNDSACVKIQAHSLTGDKKRWCSCVNVWCGQYHTIPKELPLMQKWSNDHKVRCTGMVTGQLSKKVSLHFKSVVQIYVRSNCAIVNTILYLCKYEIVQLFVSGQLQGVGAPATITISLHSYGGARSHATGEFPRDYTRLCWFVQFQKIVLPAQCAIVWNSSRFC